MTIRYADSEEAWFGLEPFLKQLIEEREITRICEIGGGANPALPLPYVAERRLDYTVLDISADELAKAPDGYLKIHQDIMARDPLLDGRFDLVFSRMVAEHVVDAGLFHRNVWHLLREEGIAFHYFPTLFALPFVVNLLVAEKLTDLLLHLVQGTRENEGTHGKFPAYYKWCRGPMRGQIERFERVGFAVDEYIGFFGHNYYRKVRPLHTLHELLSKLMLRHPLPWVTSYAYLVMRKKVMHDAALLHEAETS